MRPDVKRTLDQWWAAGAVRSTDRRPIATLEVLRSATLLALELALRDHDVANVPERTLLRLVTGLLREHHVMLAGLREATSSLVRAGMLREHDGTFTATRLGITMPALSRMRRRLQDRKKTRRG